MRFFSNRPGTGLGRKLSVAVGLAIMVSSALLTASGIMSSYELTMKTHRNNSLVKTTLLAPVLGGAVRFGKVEALEEALTGFSDAQGDLVDGARVLDTDGAPVAQIGTDLSVDALLQTARETAAPAMAKNLTIAPLTFGPAAEVVGYLLVAWSDEAIHAAMRRTVIMMTAVGLAFTALAWIAAYFVIGRMVSKPVERIAAVVREAAGGHLDVDVPMTGRGDEIGALAGDIEQLRRQLLVAAEQRASQDERDKAAEAAKARMLNALENGVGEIVRGARDGKFDRKVNDRFEDPTMQSLADGVNALCATMGDYLDELGETSQAMSAGDFNRAMPDRFGGRLGDVAVELNTSLGQISEMIAEIAATEAAMSDAIVAMRNDAIDLSSRSERQAASLEQTSAAMEQLTANTVKSSENVGASAVRAGEARSSAEDGREIVQNAIRAVDDIKTESDRISDIISVIEGIAFQTNLLALNAAVEAARAGDAGKGFAVVASEVRTLAQRAADAAGDITRLIGNSQDKVKIGAKLVNDSGAVLETIGSSIVEVSDRLTEIAASTKEQSTGIGSISEEVAQLDEATQSSAQIAVRNAAGAETLARHAQALANLLARLNQGGDADAAERLSA